MKYPNEEVVASLYGPDWRVVMMDAWRHQSFFLKVYYTITGKSLWRVVRKIEEQG